MLVAPLGGKGITLNYDQQPLIIIIVVVIVVIPSTPTP
jgi:hypothetical protein